jgi:hypothetical protein
VLPWHAPPESLSARYCGLSLYCQRRSPRASSHHPASCAGTRVSPPFEGGVARMRRGGLQASSHHPACCAGTPPRAGGEDLLLSPPFQGGVARMRRGGYRRSVQPGSYAIKFCFPLTQPPLPPPISPSIGSIRSGASVFALLTRVRTRYHSNSGGCTAPTVPSIAPGLARRIASSAGRPHSRGSPAYGHASIEVPAPHR